MVTKYRVTWNVNGAKQRGSYLSEDRDFVQKMADKMTANDGHVVSVESVQVDDAGNATAADGHTVDKWDQVQN